MTDTSNIIYKSNNVKTDDSILQAKLLNLRCKMVVAEEEGNGDLFQQLFNKVEELEEESHGLKSKSNTKDEPDIGQVIMGLTNLSVVPCLDTRRDYENVQAQGSKVVMSPSEDIPDLGALRISSQEEQHGR